MSASVTSSATPTTAASTASIPTSAPSATQSTASATSTSSGGGGGGSSGLGGSSSLYRVSGAIVIRSYVLRRRHQAIVEEAIRNGTWVPPPFASGRRGGRRDVGEKPKMWDAWVGKDREVMDVDSDAGHGASIGGWGDLLPISATYLNQRPSRSRTTTAESTSARGHASPYRRTRNFFPWRSEHARADATPSEPPSPTTPAAATPAASALNLPTATTPIPPTLRLTVLIAMPAPPIQHQHQSHLDDEEGPPVVELGVVDVSVHTPAETVEMPETTIA
ncbi:hypothetical protein FIBSPDRAFT_891880 [Athelia psychrophila]|uniref:Uncharacterized protein n=1 Tax=Athelia psychrophila TaxID=1759441 RepID=A0A166J778_9AGAM|nr:hypothetical protein FIBSPDRAFT_891880 [Fibularhizoctonia sp. CBS 109695]